MKVLDHGYLKLIESWGSDERIIEAARMSTDKGFLGWGDEDICPSCKALAPKVTKCQYCGGTGFIGKKGDEKLLRFLYENAHNTPFEMAGMVIEVQAPIFVFREWHRHRTQSYNEMSARYTPLPDVNYVPTVERLMVNAGGTNKQAGTVAGSEVLTLDAALKWLADLQDVYDHAQRVYAAGLAAGVPKELARLPIPVARYSKMRASANLRNWLGFMTLRSAPNAQKEIQAYSNVVEKLVAKCFPRTASLWQESRK